MSLAEMVELAEKVGTGDFQRFAAKTLPDESGCILWTGALSTKGYGRFVADGRVHNAHRWLWEYLHGAVPVDYEVHHRCERKNCVAPEHLEAIDRSTHAREHGRSIDSALGVAAQRRKTHCPHGHPYAGDNLFTYRTSSGGIGRGCRECRRQRTAEYRARRAD